MKRFLFFIFILFLLIPFVCAEDNLLEDDLYSSNEYYVSVDGDAGGNGSFDNPFADIKTALSQAESSDTIYLKGGTYSGVNNTALSVPCLNLTIRAVDGEKVIIDAGNCSIFNVAFDYFTVENITFINAYGVEGSCFQIWSRYTVISGCDFINDSSSLNGGALFIRNNFLTIENCNFINCSAMVGGALHLEGAQCFVQNCNFINCTAEKAGAINWFRKSSYLYNSTFISCHASGDGGAMAVNENTVNFSNITVVNCSAGKSGSVIYGPEFRGNLSYAYFFNNYARSGSPFEVKFDSNIFISNSIFLNNTASSKAIDFNITQNGRDVDIVVTFTGENSLINSFNKFTESQIRFSNVTYWGINGIMNTGDAEGFVIGAENSQNGTLIYKDYRQANQPLTVEIYDKKGNLIKNITNNTGLLGDVSLKLSNWDYGEYTVRAYHNENEYFTYISKSQDFTVSNDNIKLETNDLFMYYHDGSKFVINLTNNNLPIINASIDINLNGVNFTRLTNDEGLASININLNSGSYGINCSYVDENNVTYTSDAVIVIKPTVEGINLTKVCRNSSQFTAIFTNYEGKHLVNATVTFNINGVFYNRTTNERGIARLNINLAQGNYTITSTNPLTGESASNLVCVLPSITENKDLNLYYRNGSKYSVRLIGADGNPVGAGVNVTFNVNGVFYNRTTDSDGYARLNINLQPGDYIITAEFNGCRVSNNISVKPVLYAENLTKNYGQSDPFLVNLIDGQGNPLANQNITFNINGVFYERTTNASGVAALNINLMPGEYLITSSYNEANIVNKVKVI